MAGIGPGRLFILKDIPLSGPFHCKREYPLAVVAGGENGLAYSKGHHDAISFCDKAEEETGRFYNPSDVFYGWFRVIPSRFYKKPDFDTKEYPRVLSFARPGAKGSFPATLCYESYIQ